MTEKESNNMEPFEMSNISLKLNNYNDIFSSFDPRQFSERSLSVDFLEEARRASIDKASGEIELRLLVPENLRALEVEKGIKKRLKEHFQKHEKMLGKQYKKIIRNGFLFIVFGIVAMFLASFILFKYESHSLLTSFLVILLEPSGWFLFWEGLGQIVFETREKKPDLEFYKKMTECNISFISY